MQRNKRDNKMPKRKKQERQQNGHQLSMLKKDQEHITKAKKLVAQLLQVMALVEPFEQNKTIGKRRLRLKKIVRGKVNTLSENAEKVREIATISRDSRCKARR